MSRVLRVSLGLPVPVAVVIAYGVWSSSAAHPFFPDFDLIWTNLQTIWLFERVGSDVIPSLRNLFAGFAIAVAGGVLFGTLLGRVKVAGEMAMPLLHFARCVPPLMLIPPMILIVGVGDASKIAIVALGSFFPIMLATVDGLRQTDAGHTDAAKAMRLTGFQRFWHVWLPSSMPSIFGGVQTGLQFALVLMVSSELLASTRGIGYLTLQAQLTFNSAGVWSGIVVLAVLGFVLNAAFMRVRQRFLSWHIGMREREVDG